VGGGGGLFFGAKKNAHLVSGGLPYGLG